MRALRLRHLFVRRNTQLKQQMTLKNIAPILFFQDDVVEQHRQFIPLSESWIWADLGYVLSESVFKGQHYAIHSAKRATPDVAIHLIHIYHVHKPMYTFTYSK